MILVSCKRENNGKELIVKQTRKYLAHIQSPLFISMFCPIGLGVCPYLSRNWCCTEAEGSGAEIPQPSLANSLNRFRTADSISSPLCRLPLSEEKVGLLA